jgi:hypothetical protein
MSAQHRVLGGRGASPCGSHLRNAPYAKWGAVFPMCVNFCWRSKRPSDMGGGRESEGGLAEGPSKAKESESAIPGVKASTQRIPLGRYRVTH